VSVFGPHQAVTPWPSRSSRRATAGATVPPMPVMMKCMV
jgi:hypothetical protein